MILVFQSDIFFFPLSSARVRAVWSSTNTIQDRMVIADETHCRGRRRDATIDTRVLEVANRHLSERGFDALSLTQIAEEAGTTRQAVYRRWPTKRSLVADAIRMSRANGAAQESDDPRLDLELELAALIGAADDQSPFALAGAMLQSRTPDDALACYREHVLVPRQQRILDILQRAQRLCLIDADADLDAAVAGAIGSGYVARLSRGNADGDWAARTAAIVWRSVGGTTATA